MPIVKLYRQKMAPTITDLGGGRDRDPAGVRCRSCAAYQNNLERDVPAIVTDLTGLVVPERHHTLLTIVVLMIAVYGISKTIDRLFPSRKIDKIEESFKNLTVVAGDLIQMAPAQVEATVRGRLADKKQNQLSTAIRGFFAPAAGREGASIVGGGTEISAPVLAQIPNLSAPEAETQPDIDTKFENNQRIIIHAMARDRSKLGWAGHIPDLFEDRVPMKLDKSINLESLFTKTEIIGDVLIVYDVDDEGVRTPSEFHLLRIGHAPRAKRRKAAPR